MIEPEEVHSVGKGSMLHSSHCLASGEVMISTLGDQDANAKGKCTLKWIAPSWVKACECLLLLLKGRYVDLHLQMEIYLS